MDVDGGGGGGVGGGGEVDQSLLLQFSCMNTSDHEELIGQVQKLLGPSVNYNTASFFLDMNNWNLQAAVCSYLDYALPAKLPSMSIKAAINQAEPVKPGTSFVQSWTIANTGTDSWPANCQVAQAGGEPLGSSPLHIPPLLPGNLFVVTMDLRAPLMTGKHYGYFHLLTDRGEKIGDTLWSAITVESENTMAIVEQLAALPVPSSRDEDNDSTPHQQSSPPDDQMC